VHARKTPEPFLLQVFNDLRTLQRLFCELAGTKFCLKNFKIANCKSFTALLYRDLEPKLLLCQGKTALRRKRNACARRRNKQINALRHWRRKRRRSKQQATS
jgi:hypothetical protein